MKAGRICSLFLVVFTSCQSAEIKLDGKWQIIKDSFGRESVDPSASEMNRTTINFLSDNAYELERFGRVRKMNYKLSGNRMYISEDGIGPKSGYYILTLKNDTLQMANKSQYYLLKREDEEVYKTRK